MKCENCGSNHDGSYGSGRFCSKKCARGYATKNKRKEINDKVSISLGGKGSLRDVNSNCINCGKELYKGKKYCSTKCQHEYIWNNYCKEIERTRRFPENGTEAGVRTRRWLISQNGDKCSICGLTEWQGKPLIKIIDHIDGDAHNWSIDNIRLVCSNCDSQLDTYKAKNKNCTRKFNAKPTYGIK